MIEMWFDGACEPKNPGGYGAYGVYISCNNVEYFKEGKCVGHGKDISNNVAEYSGFIRGLEYLLPRKKEHIHVRGDSMLVIQQMQGKWRMKKGIYLPLAHKALELVEQFSKLSFEWIPREENDICDGLGKDILRQMKIQFKIQPEKLGI